MHPSRTLAISLLLGSCIAFSWASDSKPTSSQGTTSPSDDASAGTKTPGQIQQTNDAVPLDEHAIRELETIRRELGASPLKGSLLEHPAGTPAHREQFEFGSQLRELYGEANEMKHTAETIDFRTAHLRHLKRQCDLLTDELEQLQLSDDAHQVRQIGSKLLK